jgi:hypothetical protein
MQNFRQILITRPGRKNKTRSYATLEIIIWHRWISKTWHIRMCRRERTTDVPLCAVSLHPLHDLPAQNLWSNETKTMPANFHYTSNFSTQTSNENTRKHKKIVLRISFMALRPVFRPWLSHCRGFETVAWRDDVSPTPNPHRGGPGYLPDTWLKIWAIYVALICS